MEIPPPKFRVTAFKRQIPVRSKTIIDNIILEQVNILIYLGSKISNAKENGVTSKIKNYLLIMGILNNAVN
jgi:hypothetical protein